MAKYQNEWPFRDRYRAGEWLANHLDRFRDADPILLGIPRGGVEVAAAIADRLSAELDVIVARKIGAPDQPELAIGAATANGGLFLDNDAIETIGVEERYLTAAIERERSEAQRREREYRGARAPLEMIGRTVILIDDGLATGATARAAARAVRQRRPNKLVLTAPVGAREAIASLVGEVDEVICPLAPEFFWAVGGYYVDFKQLEDADVTRLLREYAKTRATQPGIEASEPGVIGQ